MSIVSGILPARPVTPPAPEPDVVDPRLVVELVTTETEMVASDFEPPVEANFANTPTDFEEAL